MFRIRIGIDKKKYVIKTYYKTDGKMKTYAKFYIYYDLYHCGDTSYKLSLEKFWNTSDAGKGKQLLLEAVRYFVKNHFIDLDDVLALTATSEYSLCDLTNYYKKLGFAITKLTTDYAFMQVVVSDLFNSSKN